MVEVKPQQGHENVKIIDLNDPKNAAAAAHQSEQENHHEIQIPRGIPIGSANNFDDVVETKVTAIKNQNEE